MSDTPTNNDIRDILIAALTQIQDKYGFAIDRVDVHWERPLPVEEQRQTVVFKDLNISGYV